MTVCSFREHNFKRVGKYKCSQGHHFQRTAKTYWTENPFHKWQGKEAELNAQKIAELTERLKTAECPKCEEVCPNLSS